MCAWIIIIILRKSMKMLCFNTTEDRQAWKDHYKTLLETKHTGMRHAKVGKEKCVRTAGSRPTGSRAGVRFVGVWGSTVSSPARSGVEHQPKSNLVHFDHKFWQLVATILMIFARINWSNFNIFYDRYDVTLCGQHSLENMDYGQKSCLALGILIQY